MSSLGGYKKSIVVGSPGIGKSTLLCVMAFHLVFKHKKNVLVYRRLRKKNQADCLFYLGYEDGKVVQFAVKGCEDRTAIDIYKELVHQQGISNVWLLLDGFRIVKLKSTSDKKGNVAYLQFTVTAKHGIDSNQLKEMNKIFYPDDVKEAGNTESPIYIANKYGIAADGPTNDTIVKSLLPHTHNLRKRQRLEE
ncbi:unnamed protein product [Peronospora farinosa]|uniref:Uncharacterized protein n=1 Tax=Peronospora farinosa TaxID=134698 RepID=A0AAV0SZP6_9STRA|nr:unnamed protein product [Peronospora farinosa]